MPFLIFLHYSVKVFDDKKKESWILRGEKRIQILLSAWMLNANEFNLYLYYIKKMFTRCGYHRIEHTQHRCYNCFAMITADMNWSWFNTISIPCIFFFFSFFAMSALCCAQTRPVNELPLSGIFLPFRAFIHSSMLFQLIFLSNITWHHLNHLKWFKQLLCHSLHRSTDHRLIV